MNNSTQNILARIRRRLAADGLTVRRCRDDSRDHHELGDYYLVDVSLNAVIEKHVDLEQLAREVGAQA